MTKKDIEADKKRNKICKKLYLHLFGSPWPKGWQIHWHVNGFTSFNDKAIYMSADSIKDSYDLETLCHEFLHLRTEMKHGKEFDKFVRKMVKEAKRALPSIRS